MPRPCVWPRPRCAPYALLLVLCSAAVAVFALSIVQSTFVNRRRRLRYRPSLSAYLLFVHPTLVTHHRQTGRGRSLLLPLHSTLLGRHGTNTNLEIGERAESPAAPPRPRPPPPTVSHEMRILLMRRAKITSSDLLLSLLFLGFFSRNFEKAISLEPDTIYGSGRVGRARVAECGSAVQYIPNPPPTYYTWWLAAPALSPSTASQ